MNKKTILVVEDERALMKAISTKLKKNEFDVLQATTIDDAWKLLQETTGIEAVWLDHYLPGGKSGFDLLVLIREDAHLKTLPVFIVSNTEGSNKLYAYTKLEIEKYFVKAKNKLDDIVSDIKTSLE